MAWVLYISIARVENRLGGTNKFIFENAIIEQTKNFKILDKTMKKFDKKMKRKINNIEYDIKSMRLIII